MANSELELDVNTWPKNISVDKRIVKILSESTYESFPRALKELITNSYDADAQNVTIKIDLKKQQIVLEDDGKGMNVSDFTFYIRIAGKKREKESGYTPAGRRIIGQFGVGFLSIFPFFKSYDIETQSAEGGEVVFASIPLAKYFNDSSGRVDIDSIDIEGGIRKVKIKSGESYTRITLTGFNDLTKNFFYPKKSENKKRKISTYEGIDQLIWSLSEDLPIPFEEEKFNNVFNYEEPIPFEVTVNKKKLYRLTYGDEILETHKGKYHQIGDIKIKYFIATPKKIINPTQGRYFKIRNLNVGVGERDDFGMDKGEGAFQRWLYGEIHVLEGLNSLIKVSRDGFNYSNDFEEVKNFFNGKLRQYSTILDQANRFAKEVKQTGREFRVSNVKLLNKDNLESKLEGYRKEGYQIKKLSSGKSKLKPIKIDTEKKQITIDASYANFQKNFLVEGRKYQVVAEKWDYKEDIFPACRIDGNRIIINQSYPLFQSIKYTDIFVKMHLLLVISYNKKQINKPTFELLSSQIMTYCSDYIKK